MTRNTIRNVVPTSRNYRNYVLLLLIVVYIFKFVDRRILVILQESIRAELGPGDKQLGLLPGFYFLAAKYVRDDLRTASS